jgi:hypothetical protein
MVLLLLEMLKILLLMKHLSLKHQQVLLTWPWIKLLVCGLLKKLMQHQVLLIHGKQNLLLLLLLVKLVLLIKTLL